MRHHFRAANALRTAIVIIPANHHRRLRDKRPARVLDTHPDQARCGDDYKAGSKFVAQRGRGKGLGMDIRLNKNWARNCADDSVHHTRGKGLPLRNNNGTHEFEWPDYGGMCHVVGSSCMVVGSTGWGSSKLTGVA